jgi:hypothetical protein
MTATVATVGMLPAAMATGVGSDVQRSVGTVVAGGLIPATFLTLFIVPTLYFVIERWAAGRVRATAAAQTTAVGLFLLAGLAGLVPAPSPAGHGPQQIAEVSTGSAADSPERLYPPDAGGGLVARQFTIIRTEA